MFYYFGPNIIAEHNIALEKPYNRSWCDSHIESETTCTLSFRPDSTDGAGRGVT